MINSLLKTMMKTLIGVVIIGAVVVIFFQGDIVGAVSYVWFTIVKAWSSFVDFLTNNDLFVNWFKK